MKFKLGNLYATQGIVAKCKENSNFNDFVKRCVSRHVNADWGEMSEEDKNSNNLALINADDRIFSSYRYDENIKVWVITEMDRSSTTILFPSEY